MCDESHNAFCAKITFYGIKRDILHPALINVVQHRDAETFEVGMFVDVGL